ncbi:hypothetical protein KC973_02470 [Candidatus Saccharibacteria bacterium]|nr:hypothetical protein [Candidatus Saccharibacteria bacterium]
MSKNALVDVNPSLELITSQLDGFNDIPKKLIDRCKAILMLVQREVQSVNTPLVRASSEWKAGYVSRCLVDAEELLSEMSEFISSNRLSSEDAELVRRLQDVLDDVKRVLVSGAAR